MSAGSSPHELLAVIPVNFSKRFQEDEIGEYRHKTMYFLNPYEKIHTKLKSMYYSICVSASACVYKDCF